MGHILRPDIGNVKSLSHETGPIFYVTPAKIIIMPSVLYKIGVKGDAAFCKKRL